MKDRHRTRAILDDDLRVRTHSCHQHSKVARRFRFGDVQTIPPDHPFTMSDTALMATMSLRSNTFISRTAYKADSIECWLGTGDEVFHSLMASLIVRPGTRARTK